jgi:hypothetical protein
MTQTRHDLVLLFVLVIGLLVLGACLLFGAWDLVLYYYRLPRTLLPFALFGKYW